MTAREAIAKAFKRVHRNVCYPNADDFECSLAAGEIEDQLDAAGFTIMSKEDVEAIRNKALEEAAVIVDCNCRKKKRPCDEYDCPREQADEIRKLKSGGRDGKETRE